MLKKNIIPLVILLILALLMTACTTNAAPEGANEETASEDVGEDMPVDDAETEDVPALKIALLPILDSLPYYVAQLNGYFEEEGVEVEVVPVASALERDQLMQSGEIDGMLTELSTVAIFNRDGVQVQALITSRRAYADAPLFRIVAPPGSEVESAADLSGQPIAISENTIIEYVSDRLLTAEGLSAEDIVWQSVPAIPERFQLLMEGQIAAATLPDPLAQSAITAGAVLVIDDSSYPEYAESVLGFSVDAVENKAESIRRFLRAWDQAAGDINADPEAYRSVMLEEVNVPPNVQETFDIPPYPRAEVPTAEQWADVMEWLIGKGLVESEVLYEDSVTPDFLP